MVNKVIAENFLSWEKLDFDVQKGVTLIDGWNDDDQTSEGSGKSAVLNALSWCLYGKIPKDANMDDVIKHGKKGCKVKVLIDGTVEIQRSRKPNHLAIIDGGKPIKGKDARETQSLIEEYIGLSFDAFCQSVYFAQNNNKKFISASQEDRGKILSEIQDLNAFDKARKEVVALIKKEEPRITEIRHSIQMEQKNLELIENQIYHENSLRDSLESEKIGKLNTINLDIGQAQEQIQALSTRSKLIDNDMGKYEVSIEEKETLINQQNTLRQALTETKGQLSNIDSISREKNRKMAEGKRYGDQYKALGKSIEKLEEFIANPTESCPTCGTLLENCDTTHAIQDLQKKNQEREQILEIMSQISNEMNQIVVPDSQELTQKCQKIQNAINEVQNNLRKASERESTYEKFNSEKNQISGKVSVLEDRVLHLKNEFNKIQAQQIVFDDTNLNLALKSKEETRQKIDSFSLVLNDRLQHLARLETLKSGFKEVKSYIFNSVLNEINARAIRYLERLFEVPVTLRFVNNNMKIGVEVTINGQPIGLGLLSGGQFRRCALAVDLALSDVVLNRKGSKLNIMILDEYFKDLSEQSMEKCLTLLESRGHPVILIEHNSIFKNIVDNSVFVKYEKGTSYSVA